MFSLIHVDAADPVIHLGKDVHHFRSLTDLEWPRDSKDTRRTGRKTAINWIGFVSSF